MTEGFLNIDLNNIPQARSVNAVSLVAKQKYVCKDCGALFALSESEIIYFLEQNHCSLITRHF